MKNSFYNCPVVEFKTVVNAYPCCKWSRDQLHLGYHILIFKKTINGIVGRVIDQLHQRECYLIIDLIDYFQITMS